MVHLWIGYNLKWDPKPPIQTKYVTFDTEIPVVLVVMFLPKLIASFHQNIASLWLGGRLLLGSDLTGQANLLGQTTPCGVLLTPFLYSQCHIPDMSDSYWRAVFFLK